MSYRMYQEQKTTLVRPTDGPKNNNNNRLYNPVIIVFQGNKGVWKNSTAAEYLSCTYYT